MPEPLYRTVPKIFTGIEPFVNFIGDERDVILFSAVGRWCIEVLNTKAVEEDWDDDRVAAWSELAQDALAICAKRTAKTRAGHAAKAAALLADLPCESIRRDGAPIGIATLSLIEDLIARDM